LGVFLRFGGFRLRERDQEEVTTQLKSTFVNLRKT